MAPKKEIPFFSLTFFSRFPKASFVCCKVDDVVYVSARSFGDVNVQRIMEKLGGGGHFTVSGAQLKDCSAEEAKERVRSAIDEYLKEETT